jgi:hypothetical protein
MTLIKNLIKASQTWSLSQSKGLEVIKTQNSKHECIYSPFEGGKSANADAGDVFIKPTKYHLILTTLSIFFFITSCTKTNNNTTSDPKASCVPTVMPPYTETGTNNIAFTIDGQVWVNNICYFDNFLQPQAYKSSVFYHPDEHVLNITAESYPNSSYNEEFYLDLSNLDKSDLKLKAGFDRGSEEILFSSSGIKPPIINKMSITKFDSINKMYCGKFDIILFRQSPSKDKRDSVHIIGFFDCKEGQY